MGEGAYEPERVQVCAQALILEDVGYKVSEGAIWYANSRERVRIALDEELRAKTRTAITALLPEQIPVTYASHGGWVLGHTVSTGHRNVTTRIAECRAAFDERRCLGFARSLVAAKIRNPRVMLRRNFKAGDEAERDAALEALARLAARFRLPSPSTASDHSTRLEAD